MVATPVPGRLELHLRRAAELARTPDDGGIEQAVVTEILQEHGEALIQFGQLAVHRLKVLLVSVPALVVDGDVGHAFFNESARHEAALAEGVATVGITNLLIFKGEIEELAGVAEDHLVGLLLRVRDGFQRGVSGQGSAERVEAAE